MLLLPLDSTPAKVFTVQLGDGNKYVIETRYNEGFLGDGGFWTFDLSRSIDGVVLVTGVPILLGQDLLSPYALGIGVLVAIDENNTDTDAGPEDLGVRVNVYWATSDELAAAAAAAPPPRVATVVVPVTPTPPAPPPAFTPLALGSTLVALYEGPGIVQGGGTATAWNDSSGNGVHLTAGAGGTYVANAGFGLPGVSFNGTTQYLTNASVNTRNRSWFGVVGGMNNPGGPSALCGAGRIYAQLGVANQMGVYVTPTFVTSGQTYNTARHSLAIIQRSAIDIDFYLDGVKVNATTGTALYADSPVSMGGLEGAGGQFTVATVEHMSICDTALSNSDVAKMLYYLHTKYGVG